MRIASIKLKNFRSYRDEVEVKIDDLTVFVGKNDIGKSTVLEALDIFINNGNGAVKMDKTDINIFESKRDNKETVITVCFEDLPEKVIIDTSVETTLEKEYLLNEHGQLEVIKRYQNGGNPKVFIKALHPSNEICEDLLTKKNSDLKKLIKELGIECENQSINSVMRLAIWNSVIDEIELKTKEIDVSKEDAKKIWEKLSKYLPIYSLFQSDRKNHDSDSEVQDPLKEAVKAILSNHELQDTLHEVANEVEKKLKEVSTRTLEKLKEIDSNIAESLNPVIPTTESLKWQDVFKNVAISGDEDIPINKRGSGVKRLVLLSFFRAEAERRQESDDNSGIVYAIEEPETSQHSENQHLLIQAFISLAQADNTQVIITTHSPLIVKKLQFSNLRLICDLGEGNDKKVVDVLPGSLHYPSLNEVNFLAFDEVTEEFHNELYGFIEYQGWKSSFISGKPTMAYVRIKPNGDRVTEQKVLTEYIRHQIHHPENMENLRFNRIQLRESIELMRTFIISETNDNGYIEPES